MMIYKDAYSFVFLGSTDRYDVYEMVFYPALLENEHAIMAYKNQLSQLLVRAKAADHKAWMVVDLSQLLPKHMLGVTYRLALPFIRSPLVAKTYGMHPDVDPALQQDVGLLRQITRISFGHAVVANREAALPLGFMPLEQEQPKGKNAV